MPIHYGDKVRIRHCSTNHRLHSHAINYPGGSSQQQVTCFSGKDDNDWWRFKPPHGHPGHGKDGQPVRNGDHVRLEHCLTGKNLHSHRIRAHCTGSYGDQHEVSCFQKHQQGDKNDNWRVECRGNLDRSDHFKLIHIDTNGALHSHTHKYSFIDQQEVTTFLKRDNNDNWKIEDIERLNGGGNQGQNVGNAIGVGVGLAMGMAAMGINAMNQNQQQPPPPVYQQQPPPAAYPPPQQGQYPPVQQGQYPPVPQNLPANPPPPNSTVHVASMNSSKNLRNHQGVVDARGGNGKFAKFMVQPTGFLRLDSFAHPGQFLRIRQNQIDHGPGGKACELIVTGTPYPGIVTLSHAGGNGYLASDPQGNVFCSKTTGPNERATHWRLDLC